MGENEAQAYWDLGDHVRAIDLATKARDAFVAAGEPTKAAATEASEWLAVHQH